MGKEKLRLLLIVGVLVLVLGGAYLFVTLVDTEPPVMVRTGATALARDFTAEDEAGNMVQLSELIDQPTLVYFWTTWCDFCTRGMDELALLYEEVGDEMQILAVNLSTFGNRRGEAELGRAFMEEMDFSFSSLYDTQGEASRAYGVTAIPMMLLLGADGTLYHSQLGFMELDAMRELIAEF